MKQLSRRDRFYRDVGGAMAMNSMRSFINMETLEVDIHVGEDAHTFDEADKTFTEALANPARFLPLEEMSAHESFSIMEAFTGTVKDNSLRDTLTQALERKRLFANFKQIIDNSPLREQWFGFCDAAHATIAKDWLEENANDELKEKIKALPAVFIAE